MKVLTRRFLLYIAHVRERSKVFQQEKKGKKENEAPQKWKTTGDNFCTWGKSPMGLYSYIQGDKNKKRRII